MRCSRSTCSLKKLFFKVFIKQKALTIEVNDSFSK
jgi:hypothetical protein